MFLDKHYIIQPINSQAILDSSNSKDSADNLFKINAQGFKNSYWVEKNVWKGEMAHYEPFLLFTQCFPKTFSTDT